MPQPAAAWRFHPDRLRDGALVALVGPDLQVSGNPRGRDGGLAIYGPADSFTYPWGRWKLWPDFPRRAFTVVLVARCPRGGRHGLANCRFDDGEGLRGWALTLERGQIHFHLATPQGWTLLATPSPGGWATIAASYDGQTARLFVDGALQVTGDAALGELHLYGRTPFALGGWWQGDTTLGYTGVLRHYALYDTALSPDDVATLAFDDAVPPLPETPEPETPAFSIAPTFQRVGHTEATVVWESVGAVQGEVAYTVDGRTRRCNSGPARIHKVRLTDLPTHGEVRATVTLISPSGKTHTSPPQTFRTLPPPGAPLTFTTVGDTQDRPEVNGRIAIAMRAENPDLGLIVGDLVNAGWEKRQWTDDFFGSMRPLWEAIPLFPALGNHDRNARLYYDLMALPEPRYRYAFTAGDAAFFILDTERSVAPGSPQWRWLERELSRCTSPWKIVAHHHPPYSSDDDDYGTDLGDLSIRPLTALYDRYGVDLVLNGHIHSYERTRPLRGGAVAEDGRGTVYVVVGGGGGDLERFLPEAPPFSAVRWSGHHWARVRVDGGALAFDAFTLDGAPLDSFTLRKG